VRLVVDAEDVNGTVQRMRLFGAKVEFLQVNLWTDEYFSV
jgi:hypothetical protein